LSTDGDLAGFSIESWNGAAWHALGPGLWGHVTALAVYQGKLVVGGWYLSVGGLQSTGLGLWDGNQWQTLGANALRQADVRALLVRGDNLYVGGLFQLPGETHYSYLARWDGTRWHHLGRGPNFKVLALAEYDGSLFVGGNFTSAGDKSAFAIARWDGERTSPVNASLRVKALYPNPTTSRATIWYDLPQSGLVQLTVHDVAGREVARLVDWVQDAGEHSLTWNGRAASGEAIRPGIYFVRLRAPSGDTQGAKLVRLE